MVVPLKHLLPGVFNSVITCPHQHSSTTQGGPLPALIYSVGTTHVLPPALRLLVYELERT